MPQDFLTLEGVPSSMRGAWSRPVPLDAELAGIFGKIGDWFSHAFKPPAPVRSFVKKTVRYAGAALPGPSMFMTASQRARVFGLSENESRKFETINKVERGVAAAVAVVATGGAIMTATPAAGAGGAAGAAGAHSLAAGTLTFSGSGTGIAAYTGATAATQAGIWASLAKFGAVALKVGTQLAVFSSTPAGQVLISTFLIKPGQNAGVDAMPENQPVPVSQEIAQAVGQNVPQEPAGSGGGGFDTPEGYPYEEVVGSSLVNAEEKMMDPGSAEEATRVLTPAQQQLVANADAFDNVGLTELLHRARAKSEKDTLEGRWGLGFASRRAVRLANPDGSYSLQGLLRKARQDGRLGRLGDTYKPVPGSGSIFEPFVRATWATPEERFRHEYEMYYLPQTAVTTTAATTGGSTGSGGGAYYAI